MVIGLEVSGDRREFQDKNRAALSVLASRLAKPLLELTEHPLRKLTGRLRVYRSTKNSDQLIYEYKRGSARRRI